MASVGLAASRRGGWLVTKMHPFGHEKAAARQVMPHGRWKQSQ
jgi:hypothetical protein